MNKSNEEKNNQPAYWNQSVEDIMRSFGVSVDGLSVSESEERLKQYGANTLKKSSKTSDVLLFLLQFKSPLTLLLLTAATLSVFLGDRTDAIIIFGIVIISSVLGFFQERGAANAVAQLLKIVQIRCTVW